MACHSCLAMLANFHSENYGAIRKSGSDIWRAAPVFDYSGSFGFVDAVSDRPDMLACPFAVELLCAHVFSFLDSSWDWSWYDPLALDGFEDRIVEACAPYQGLPSNFTQAAVGTFTMQRNYVNQIASA